MSSNTPFQDAPIANGDAIHDVRRRLCLSVNLMGKELLRTHMLG